MVVINRELGKWWW